MDEFACLLLKFRANELVLPLATRQRLNFIVSRIEGQPFKEVTVSEDLTKDIQELKSLDGKALKLFFCVIVKTLTLPEHSIKVYSQIKCMLKKKGPFKTWLQATISYDNQNQQEIRLAYEKTVKKFNCSRLQLNHIKRSKCTLEFSCNGSCEFSIKFKNDEDFKNQLRNLEEIISQANSCKKKIQWEPQDCQSIQSASQCQTSREPSTKQSKDLQFSVEGYRSRVEQAYYYGEQKIEEFPSGLQQAQCKPYAREVQEMPSMILEYPKKKIAKIDGKSSYELCSPQFGYIIHKSKTNLLISMSQSQAKVRIEYLTSLKEPLDKVLSCLSNQKGWNSQIFQEGIIRSRAEENSVEIYRSFRQFNFVTSPRELLIKIQFQNIDQKTAIISEYSIFNKEVKEKCVRALISTKMQATAHENGIKILIQSEFAGQGFCQFKNSQQMLIRMYEDIGNFENYYKFCKVKNAVDRQLFHTFQADESIVQAPVEKETKSESNIQNAKTEPSLGSLQGSKQFIMDPKDEFQMLRPSKPIEKPPVAYMKYLRSRQYQSFYLQSRFNQEILATYDDYTPFYTLREMLNKGGEYEINENKQLIFVNQDVLDGQKDSLIFVLKQMGTNFISGKNIMNVSLPVEIFEARSLLERSAASFGCAPDLLLSIADSEPTKQIKGIFAFIASIPTLELIMQKPFNPILGETFEAYIKGIPIYYEQISHHPPISAYYMTCPQFTLHGNLNAFADAGLNSVVGGNIGVMHIIYPNGNHYQCHFPPCQISGLIYGQRKFRAYGRGYIIEKQHRLFVEFSIEKPKKNVYDKRDREELRPGDILGGIFRVTPKFVDIVQNFENTRKFGGISKEHIEQKISSIRGVWFQEITIDEEPMSMNVKTYPVQYPSISLPSDSNFRTDVMCLRHGCMADSQREKQVLENLQRADRKMREKEQKQHKKRRN